LLAVEKTCPSMTSQVDLFIIQEIGLLSECLNDPVDEFEESHVQAELSALYILWIAKAVTTPFTQPASVATVYLLE
jgi:protein prenyltransferase alpha subunit repeat containing protein 1